MFAEACGAFVEVGVAVAAVDVAADSVGGGAQRVGEAVAEDVVEGGSRIGVERLREGLPLDRLDGQGEAVRAGGDVSGAGQTGVGAGQLQAVFGGGMAQEPEHGDPVLGGGGEHQRPAAAGDAPPAAPATGARRSVRRWRPAGRTVR
jgi:hypothetical protein